MAFQFSLERILSWRRTEHRLAEAKLMELTGALERVRREKGELADEAASAAALRPERASGAELAATVDYREHLTRQMRQLETVERSCLEKVEQQRQRVMAADRARQLLEDRREREREEWQAGERRLVDQEADEFFLSRWTPGE
jgi:flagellar biosynthesis chaperone FliJ